MDASEAWSDLMASVGLLSGLCALSLVLWPAPYCRPGSRGDFAKVSPNFSTLEHSSWRDGSMSCVRVALHVCVVFVFGFGVSWPQDRAFRSGTDVGHCHLHELCVGFSNPVVARRGGRPKERDC